MNIDYNDFLTLTNISRFTMYYFIQDQFSHNVSSSYLYNYKFLKNNTTYMYVITSHVPIKCFYIPFSVEFMSKFKFIIYTEVHTITTILLP